MRKKEQDEAEQDGLMAETPDDYERLLLTEGNSSAVWIRYMAYYLKTKEVDKARAVAQRGLKTISSHEDKEKFNLWVSLLNLEAEYGSGDTLQSTIENAVKYNDEKKVRMQLTFLYQQRGKFDKLIEACKNCCKKYPESKKVSRVK